MKVAVVGAGSFGITLAKVFAVVAQDVVLSTRDRSVADSINSKHVHPKRFSDVILPPHLRATISLKDALAYADIVVCTLPMKALREGSTAINKYIRRDAIFVSTTKGIESGSHRFAHQILNETLQKHDEHRRTYLSGPNFASEIIRGLVWAAVVASEPIATAEELQRLLSDSTLRVYTSTDVVGVELGGALKNVYAIAAGILDGLNLGCNARAALMTRALNELSQIGLALQAEPKTIYGLSGLGDLLLSCTSSQSRNWRVGNSLALGKNAAQIQEELGEVAEGIETTAEAVSLARDLGVEAPICFAVNEVLQGRMKPLQAIGHLMNRQASEE